ncbi:MAG: hypothetical protein K6T88_17760 [Bacillus sp. (in: Bacteria)]|nr:hypothetical protein [Bacillus sp. (in: firmicutes)]
MSTVTKKGVQAEDQEVGYNSNRLVDTLWNQFEQSVDQARNFRERREEAYLNTLKEVVKFNQQFRGSLAGVFQTSREISNELVKGVSSNLGKKGEEGQVVRPELKEQFGELSERLEELTMAPIAAGLDMIQRFEENLVNDSEKYVHFARDRRESLQKVTDGYMNLAKENNIKLVHRLEESGKVLVNSK